MPDIDLHQLGVLVTRPAHQAEGLCHRIEQANGQVARLPLIEIAPPGDESAARQRLESLASFDIVIFISANAVHRCHLYIGGVLADGPQIATVGQATARQLRADFQRDADLVPADGYNSEALLALPALQQVAGKQILIIKGEGGREVLAETLADRGAKLSYANLYRRKIPAAAEQQLTTIKRDEKPDLIVLTSGEGIMNLLSLADETSRAWLCSMSWLVIHPRLVDVARQAGCDNEIIVSDGPGDKNIVQCIQQWQHKTNL